MAASAPPGPRSIGEFDFLDGVQRLVEGGGSKARLGRGVAVGIGDDCAVVAGSPRTLLTTDCQIEGVHFRRGWLTARELGVRAFRVAVSDIAAMGGRPRYVLLSLEIPVASSARGFDAEGAKAIVRGVAREASRCGASLVGGNVSAARDLGVTVSVVGEARRRAATRSGARAGDLVFVTGSFGGAAAALRVLGGARGRAALAAAAASRATLAYRRPPLRIEVGAELAERGLVRAMIDVSDGLVQDLGHICERSKVTIRLDPRAVPLHPGVRHEAGCARVDAKRAGAEMDADMRLALAGGEDYELAFTAAPRQRAEIERVAERLRCIVTLVGAVEAGGARVIDPAGHPLVPLGGGFDHLRRRR